MSDFYTTPYNSSDDIRTDYLDRYQEHMAEECIKCDWIDNLCPVGEEILDSMNQALEDLGE